LTCAAVLPERVLAAVCVSGLAPFGAEGLDWFAGMTPSGAAELRAALAAHFASAGFDPDMITPADHAALSGPWSWIGTVVLARWLSVAVKSGAADDEVGTFPGPLAGYERVSSAIQSR
jgi:hypothetical protein